jgi:hypothetical protein
LAIPWHRIFGMALTQYFAGTAWEVDVEVDFSLQQQRLDIAVVRRGKHSGPLVLPDGFGTPADFNLLTFKALKDPLDPFAIKELVGHSVNYRKYISPDLNHLLPEDQFRLFAASMQYPRGLGDRIALHPQSPGAYDIIWGTDTIRILVLREMPEAEQNLVWNLFSGDRGHIAAAFQRLQPRVQSWSSLLNELLDYYGLEGMAMPYTMDDFEREVEEKFLQKLTPEKRLQGLSPEQRLEGLPLEDIENYMKKQKAAHDKTSPEPGKP